MRNAFVFRLLCMTLAWAVVFGMVLPASAAVVSDTAKSAVLSTSTEYPGGYFAYMTTTTYTKIVVPIYESQAAHYDTASTTLGVSEAETREAYASGSLGCSGTAELGVELADLADISLSRTLSAQLEVGASVSYTVSVNVSYTLGSDAEPGLYRLTIVFPRKTVQKRVVGVNRYGIETTLWSERVTYAPEINAAYWSIERYSDLI